MEDFQFHEAPIELTLANMCAADILVRCSSVCKKWNEIIGNSMDLWQTLLSRDYKGGYSGQKKRPSSWKREYENLFKRLLQRENAIETCIRANPLFDIEMLETSITSNIANLNKPRIHLRALLFAQHRYAHNDPSAPIVNLDIQALYYLSHVLSRFCAEFLYDVGVVAIEHKNALQITPECIRIVTRNNLFFSSVILASMVGSPIRIHSQNIYNLLSSLQWENPDKEKGGDVSLSIGREALAITLSFMGDVSVQLVHTAIALAKKKGLPSVDRETMCETVSSMFPPDMVARINGSDYGRILLK